MSKFTLENIIKTVQQTNRKPNFQNILSILKNQIPSRPTLFEFIFNDNIYNAITGETTPADDDAFALAKRQIRSFHALGYDYATLGGWQLGALVFPKAEKHSKASKSLNDGITITNRESFEKYPWPDPITADYSVLDKLKAELPEGMKLIVTCEMGILETVIDLIGYENLCLKMYMEPDFIEAIFEAVGSRILQYYEKIVKYDAVGAVISNDDWGFKTQTMIAPDDLRRWVFPWNKKIVKAAHDAGKPAILHSCGNMEDIFDDIIDDMQFDGKHSYEDNIHPVEKAIERWGERIAILGGIDLDFIVSAPQKDVYSRAKKLTELSMKKGGVAIGSGNSIPDFVPAEKYSAMVLAALEH